MVHQNRMGRRIQVRKIKKPLMFSSLFSRLIAIYISILIIILAIVFFSLAHVLQTYLIKDTFDLMRHQAEGILSEFRFQQNHNNETLEDNVTHLFWYIRNINKWRETTSWIVDSNGIGYKISSNGIFELKANAVLANQLREIFSNPYVEYTNYIVGNDPNNPPSLCIGYPIEVNGKAQFAVLICTPMESIVDTIKGMQNLMLNVVSIVGSIAFILIYVVSRQMINPLKEMNIAAKHIAEGKFNERINIVGNDEIAELSISLNAMAEALDKIEENRRNFIANISHDLRSPLTSIQGFTIAILDGTITPDNQERYLNIVLSETQRMITMVNTILNLEQIQGGKIILKKEVFNINEVLKSIAMSLETRAKNKNLSIITTLDEDNDEVIGDIEYISRVIQNLLDNAFKFVKENGHIILQTKVCKQKLWVSILNDGPPIPKEQQKLIWERFYKEDSSRGSDKKGIGLGLVIAKEIIRRHNEVIKVHSEEGEMVEFCFSMTLAPKG